MIVDTNGLSAFADGDPVVGNLLLETAEIAVPVIVLGEFRYGIRGSRHRAEYENWLAESLSAFRVLAIDEDTARWYAELRFLLKRRGRPIPANDLWIASLARQHGLPVLSRDRHFDAVPRLKRIGW